MAVRVEFILLSAAGIVEASFGTPVKLTTSATATLAGSRPVVPAGASHARVTALDGAPIVEWGDDPTAAQNNGILLAVGMPELIAAPAGRKLSFVELA